MRELFKNINPEDPKSHHIILMLSEELDDERLLSFVNDLFTEGSILLPCLIYRNNKSPNLKNICQNFLEKKFLSWSEARISYAIQLSQNNKDPYLQISYRRNYEQFLEAIRLLEFPKELMGVLYKFIQSNQRYLLGKYNKSSFESVLYDWSISDINTFIELLMSEGQKVESNEYLFLDYVSEIIRFLAHSVKMFEVNERTLVLIENFRELLNIEHLSGLNTYFLVEIIKRKNLDLSKGENKVLTDFAFEGGYFSLSSSFVYEFFFFFYKNGYKLKRSISVNGCESILASLNKFTELDFNKLDFDSDSCRVINVFTNDKNTYFGLFLKYLAALDLDLRKDYLLKYLNKISILKKGFRVRNVLRQFDLAIPLIGEVTSIKHGGFIITLAELHDDLLCPKGECFLPILNFNANDELRNLYRQEMGDLKLKSSKKYSKNIFLESKFEFIIQKINLAKSNKNIPVILDLPYEETLTNIKELGLSPLCSEVDDYLIELILSKFELSGKFKLEEVSFNNLKLFSNLDIELFSGLSKETLLLWLEEYRPLLFENFISKDLRYQKWITKIEIVFRERSTISGTVVERVSGGFRVDIDGFTVFLPGSQYGSYISDYNSIVGETVIVMVLSVPNNKSIVVSQKEVFALDNERKSKVLREQMEIGQIYTGKIKNIMNYGVFIDLGGVDGLVHVSDLSWNKSDVILSSLNKGEEVEVIVLRFDKEKERISLGIKQLHEDPWNELSSQLNIGDKVSGKVVNIESYGVFINVSDGVHGLIHKTEISSQRTNDDPAEVYAIGDLITAEVVVFDVENRKLALSIRLLETDLWDDELIKNKYPIGRKVVGKIIHVAIFGLFVELESGLEGLIHNTEISWSMQLERPRQAFSVGDKIECLIISLDFSSRKISLSHKRLADNPWQDFLLKANYSEPYNGTVKYSSSVGFVIRLSSGVEGICQFKNSKKENGHCLKIDDQDDFYIAEIDVDKGSLELITASMVEDTYLNEKNQRVRKKVEKYKKGEVFIAEILRVEYQTFIVRDAVNNWFFIDLEEMDWVINKSFRERLGINKKDAINLISEMTTEFKVSYLSDRNCSAKICQENLLELTEIDFNKGVSVFRGVLIREFSMGFLIKLSNGVFSICPNKINGRGNDVKNGENEYRITEIRSDKYIMVTPIIIG